MDYEFQTPLATYVKYNRYGAIFEEKRDLQVVSKSLSSREHVTAM
jgi:hypothetical protein